MSMNNITKREFKKGVDYLNKGEDAECLANVFNLGLANGKARILRAIESTNRQLFDVLIDILKKKEEYGLVYEILKEYNINI